MVGEREDRAPSSEVARESWGVGDGVRRDGRDGETRMPDIRFWLMVMRDADGGGEE